MRDIGAGEKNGKLLTVKQAAEQERERACEKRNERCAESLKLRTKKMRARKPFGEKVRMHDDVDRLWRKGR